MIYYSDAYISKKYGKGFVIFKDDELFLHVKVYEEKTVNELEYLGVINACKIAKIGDTILTDSKLVVGHCCLKWQQNFEHLKPLTKEVQGLLYNKKLILQHVGRELNKAGLYIDNNKKNWSKKGGLKNV